jgi:signal transduction histidine kinase/CheY-like chemotaxis protein
MSESSQPTSRDDLVLVLAPTGRDMPLACQLLTERASISCEPVADVADLCEKIRRGAGVVVMAEEALDDGGARRLLDTLNAQLPWSDLPILVLARNDGDDSRGISALNAVRQRANVTVLGRPARILTLLTAVQSALRARHRQYEVRDLLAETRNAVRQRDQFLAMLGHELRNPLGAISSAMNVIEAACPASDDLETEQRGIIRRQVDHLARLVDDLLDVSRITSGKVVLQRKPIDLCELAKRAAQAVRAPMQSQQHTLVLDVECDPVIVDADPVRMEQVINNLLTNAIKYTQPGGKIHLDVKEKDKDAIIRVRDNGMGIAPELLPRVFDLFTQADRALDRAQGGLGIGLTLVRSLVEMHDGQVVAHSDGPGKGSEFVITLPKTTCPLPAATPLKPAAAVDPVRRRILIIEDQADARRALQRLLQIWGHQVEVAEDGPRGVETAMKTNPDVAFIDVGLPGLDGYEVARQLRRQLGQSIRLIALTGYGQPEDRDRAFAAGFDLHLVKPVDRDQLSRSLTEPLSAPTPQQKQPV